ncbi:uncharacterized protein FYW47_012202 [Aplochiton taeniatus]
MSKDQKVPFYVISLLISDIFNFIGRPQAMTETVLSSDTTTLIFYFGIVSNITFMVCIAQERHLLVTYPHCHGCCSRLKKSALVSLVIWGAPFVILGLAVFKYFFWFAVALLVPFPFLLFFVLDSWRALLCCGTPSTRAERRKTVGGLAVILGNYTLLFLPFIIHILLESLSFKEGVRYLGLVSNLLLYLSPLVDPFLYILMTKGPRDVLEALPCWKKKSVGQEEGPQTSAVATVSETTCDTRL